MKDFPFSLFLAKGRFERARLSELEMMKNQLCWILQIHIQVEKDQMSNRRKKVYILVAVKTSSSQGWVFQNKILDRIY